jgi:hypothetical protein
LPRKRLPVIVSEAVSVLGRHGVSVVAGPGDAFTIFRLEPAPPVFPTTVILKAVVSPAIIEWLCEKFPDIPESEFYEERLIMN